LKVGWCAQASVQGALLCGAQLYWTFPPKSKPGCACQSSKCNDCIRPVSGAECAAMALVGIPCWCANGGMICNLYRGITQGEYSVVAGGEFRLAADSTYGISRHFDRGAARPDWVRQMVYPAPRDSTFSEILADGI